MPTTRRRTRAAEPATAVRALEQVVAANAAAAPSPGPTARIDALRKVLFDTIEAEVRGGNIRVILWLADRLRLLDVQETGPRPHEELRTMLDSLQPEELKEFASLAAAHDP